MSPRPLHRSVLLWRLRRHPVLWWAAAAAAVGFTALALQSSLAAAARCPSAAPPAAPAADGDGLAASVPADARALAVPTSGGLALSVGDEVDLVAPGEVQVEGGDVAAGSRTVAEAAVVVQVAVDVVTVAVPEQDAADAALAAAQGGTTLVLRGQG